MRISAAAATERALDDGALRALVGQEPFLNDRSHADPAVVARKHHALNAPHVAPFLAWRAQTAEDMDGAGIADAEDHLLHVDPASGGMHARVVVLHAGPVPCGLAVNGGSGLVSADNVEGPAARMWRLARAAGLARAEVVEWNAVPWDSGLALGRALASRSLVRWLGVLRRPERVVLLGARARQFRADVESVLPGVEVTTAPSASQMARMSAPDFEEQIVRALSR